MMDWISNAYHNIAGFASPSDWETAFWCGGVVVGIGLFLQLLENVGKRGR